MHHIVRRGKGIRLNTALRRRDESGGLRRALIGLVPIYLLASLGQILRLGGEGSVSVWSHGALTLANLLFVLSAVATSRRVPDSAKDVWRLFAVGGCLLLMGQLVWDYDVIRGSVPASPAIYDIGFLGAALPLALAFLCVPRGARLSRALLALDLTIVALALAILFGVLFLADIHRSPLSYPGRAIAILYPVLYATLACAALLVPIRRAWRDLSMGLLLLGLACEVVPFLLLPSSLLSGATGDNAVLNWWWTASFLLIAASGLTFRAFPDVPSDARTASPMAWLPIGLSASAVIVVLVFDIRTDLPGVAEQGFEVLVAALLALAAARLGLTLCRTRALVYEAEEAAAQLRESEDRYRRIIETTSEGVWMIDTNLQTTLVNPKMAEMLGYSVQEMIGKSLFDFLDEEGRAIAARNVEQRRYGIGTQRDARLIRKDGTAIWVMLGTDRVVDREGNYAGSLAMVTDISGRREAERTRAHLAAIVESSEDAIISKTLNGMVTSWNQAAERLYGYTADEMIGRSISVLVPEGRSDEVPSLLERVSRGGRIEHYETVRRHRDGRLIDVALSISPIRDADGTVSAGATIARDVTEQKRAQEAIQQLNSELERRVAERTAELRAANQDLESFAYSVSHDLRAPLRSITGFSQAVLEDYGEVLDEEGQENLEIIVSSCKEMSELIDGLLRLSRVTRAELTRERLDLSELAREVIAELGSTAPDRRVEWLIQPDVRGYADRSLIRAVLENLLGNAWKYTGKRGQPHIEFGVEVDEHGHCVYFVRDNGAGFDMTYADKLFHPFQRLHSAGEFEGSGIGLATVRRILQRHDGAIWAEGVPGEGATFYFTLEDRSCLLRVAPAQAPPQGVVEAVCG